MILPQRISDKYLGRFATLAEEGEAIRKAVVTIPGDYYEDVFGNRQQDSPRYKIDLERLVCWKTNCISILDQVIPKKSAHAASLTEFRKIVTPVQISWGISTLKGLADDLKHGFLSDISTQIETAIAADYMGQAEGLLKEGQSAQYDHVPAAVLAGAVLEKALRMLCAEQTPPVDVLNARGEKKTLNPLIEDLRRAGAFNEMKAKQLRSWAATRNHAAHGEFTEFDRNDVEQMLRGINHFLAEFS